MSDSFLKVRKGITLAPQSSEPSNPTNGDIYYDSSLNKFRKYENGAWTNLNTGGQGGINYIENSQIEENSDGYFAYKDADQDTPEDGLGGSPSVVSVGVTAASIRGLQSLLISKATSVSGRGEGVAITGKLLNFFTIDDIDTNSDILVQFDYKILNGTYESGDFVAYAHAGTGEIIPIRNDDNGSLIFHGGNGTKFQGYFTANNDPDYRILLHCARFGDDRDR
jgi:hypothetical protein